MKKYEIMKHFSLISLLVISLFGLIACNKNNNTEPKSLVTISGKVVKSCDDTTPVAGLELYLAGDKSNSPFNTCHPKRISTVTDENGNFSLSYNPRKDLCLGDDIIDLELAYDDEWGNFRSILNYLPTSKKDDLDVKNRTFYLQNTTYLTYEIKMDQQEYTNKDTLFVIKKRTDPGNPIPPMDTFTGPFFPGQIVGTAFYSIQLYDESRPCMGFRGHFVNSEGQRTDLNFPSESCFGCRAENKVFIKLP